MICIVCDDLRQDQKLSALEDCRQFQTQQAWVPFIMFKQLQILCLQILGANYSNNNMMAVNIEFSTCLLSEQYG